MLLSNFRSPGKKKTASAGGFWRRESPRAESMKTVTYCLCRTHQLTRNLTTFRALGVRRRQLMATVPVIVVASSSSSAGTVGVQLSRPGQQQHCRGPQARRAARQCAGRGPAARRPVAHSSGVPVDPHPAAGGRPSSGRMVRRVRRRRSSVKVLPSSRRSAHFRRRCDRQRQFTQDDRRPGPRAGFEQISSRSAGHPAGRPAAALPAPTGAVRCRGGVR
jgi:hypothetical protein